MKRYVGTKYLIAKPMNRIEYNQYRSWDFPKNEKGMELDEGYLVEYENGGPSNHPNHKGYISWSPKEVFESTYKETT
jgi:hypothetical protein